MRDFHSSFISRSFLRSAWDTEYKLYQGSDEEASLETRLLQWADRDDLKETSAEGPLVEQFFRQTWDYTHSGQVGSGESYTLIPKFPIKGGSAKGGQGYADLAAGYFEKGAKRNTPQILAEFKDIKSALDAPQKGRRGSLSPVKQCLNYLSAARRGLFGTEPVLPNWGIVTDMNEFRLYWHDRAPQQFIRFIIRQQDMLSEGMVTVDGRLVPGDEARFDRFLFSKLFHRDTLTTRIGKPLLLQLIEKQWVKERQLEKTFYAEYRAYREALYKTLVTYNPQFPGTKGRLVRLAQKILDRCIFVFFCEDMGAALQYPPQLLRDFLIKRSSDEYFDPLGATIWTDLKRLFSAMNVGSDFGPHKINQFNGGLFKDDPELDSLIVPNEIFCHRGQGQDEASLYAYPLTLLYFSASYNFAGGWSEGLTRPKSEVPSSSGRPPSDKSIGLYTLGRIFEQSITELEILEAEADDRPSLNKESKRKRDGVFYTPEWIVERVVAETLDPLLAELKEEAGWSQEKLPTVSQIDSYWKKLEEFRVVDPACGSGAFLITTLQYLLNEFKIVQATRQQVTGKIVSRDDNDLIRSILQSNIYGVDINPASVEIARLALWLHTARGNQPLSSLETRIREGNSLIDKNFFKGQIDLTRYDAEEKDRVNAFTWEDEFPEVFKKGKLKGFDAVVGNPPYVKLQNFRTVHEDMAIYIREGRPEVDIPGYESARTHNFDLYLPFIEKGLSILNDRGRLGYIAPSLWTINDYGAGLRNLIARGKNLDRWLDFKSHQIFEEATTYTALQFFTKKANSVVRVAYAPDGTVLDDPWAGKETGLPYDRIAFEDRWLLLTGAERRLIDKLKKNNPALEDKELSEQIFQGVKTGADPVYKLEKIANGRYYCAGNDTEVELEDALMRQIVSGYDTKRYTRVRTRNYLLFPYRRSGGRVELIDQEEMVTKYPKAWKYLSGWRSELIKRDNGDLDDQAWYRFSRSQSLDQIGFSKLYAAGTVKTLQFTYDQGGELFLTGGRVDGVRPSSGINPMYLLGVLNSDVATFVFRRLGRVKANGWFEANKQFIAPLPIPRASKSQQKLVGHLAATLLDLHTNLADAIDDLGRRIDTGVRSMRPESFLFPDLLTLKEWQQLAPKTLSTSDRKVWAKEQLEKQRNAHFETIAQRLYADVPMEARITKGELSFLVDGVPVIDRVFVSGAHGNLVLAQWKFVANRFSVTDKTTPQQLCRALLNLLNTENQAQIDQIIEFQVAVDDLLAAIKEKEDEINSIVRSLYKLSASEVELISRG